MEEGNWQKVRESDFVNFKKGDITRQVLPSKPDFFPFMTISAVLTTSWRRSQRSRSAHASGTSIFDDIRV